MPTTTDQSVRSSTEQSDPSRASEVSTGGSAPRRDAVVGAGLAAVSRMAAAPLGGGGGVQMKGGGGLASDQVLAHAEAGLSGSAASLPHGDTIQRAFGSSHDLSGVQAHVGGPAASAASAIGAQAYATGSHVAFRESPDLHTAAHEAAHVVQQRSGVHLKGGVGESGDRYERQADAVADAVVAGHSAAPLLAEYGGRGGAAGVQSKAVQLIGTPLDKELPADAEQPAHGDYHGQQRRYAPEQYIAMWEKEQGRKMTAEDKETISRGCIGISAQILQGGGNPLDYAEKVYGSFDPAHAMMVEKNKALDEEAKKPGHENANKTRYVMFAKLFWSNQSADWEARLKPDDKAFKPDAKTGEVDMSGYQYRAQSRWKTDPTTGEQQRYGYVNFDYGFWDESSNCFWHANHMQYKDPEKAKTDPMIVLQSTREKFTKGYIDFDRIIFCVAKAENYNPALAAMANAGGGGH